MWTLPIYFVLWNCRSTYPTFMREKIKCEVCLFAFSLKENLKMHISSVHEGKNLKSVIIAFTHKESLMKIMVLVNSCFHVQKKLMCKNSLQQVSRCNLGSWKSIGGTLFWIPSGLVEYMGLVGIWFVLS